MKNIKYILLLLVVQLVLCLPLNISAADKPELTFEMETSVSVPEAGKEFELTISIKENPGFVYAGLELHYDPAQLTFISAEKGSAITQISESRKKENVRLIQCGAPGVMFGMGGEVLDEVGELITYTFKVAENLETEVTVDLVVNASAVFDGSKYDTDGMDAYMPVEVSKAFVCNDATITFYTIDKATHVCETWEDDWKDLDDIPETCTTVGYTDRKWCPVCEEECANTPIEAHKHTIETTQEAVDATCTEVGYTAEIKCVCTKCNCTYVEQERTELKALGHDVVAIAPVDRTCIVEGFGPGEECARCGDILKEPESLGYAPHEFDEGVVNPAPTCTEDGTRTKTCTVCEKATEVVVEPKLGHDPVNKDGTPATCLDTDVTCSRCKQPIAADDPKAPGAHNFPATGDIKPAPTCTAEGTETFTCTKCGDKTTKTLPAAGHKHVATTKVEATCTTDGYTKYVCSVCDDTYFDDEVTAFGHKPVDFEAVAPGCTTTGLTAGKQCSVCKTWTEPQQVVDALGHTIEKIPAVPVECKKDGKTEGEKCSVCNEVLKEQETVKQPGHKYGSYVVVKEATTTSTGLKQKTCKTCGYVYKKTIAKLEDDSTTTEDTTTDDTTTDDTTTDDTTTDDTTTDDTTTDDTTTNGTDTTVDDTTPDETTTPDDTTVNGDVTTGGADVTTDSGSGDGEKSPILWIIIAIIVILVLLLLIFLLKKKKKD